MNLFDGERCDEVNDSLKLIQKTDGLTFGTDALLLAAYINGVYRRGIELGGGTGIISMLLSTRNKISEVECVEIQPQFVDLINRNLELNGLLDRISAVCCDVRNYVVQREFDICFTNPPYMRADSGKRNVNDMKNVARHEENGTIEDFCSCASKALKFGGCFAAVYRPDRLSDLMAAMRAAKLEPKRMTFVHADVSSVPSMVLLEAKKNGRCGMKLTRPLIIYKEKNHREYSDDMAFIMEHGSFPKDFGV